MTKTTSVDIYSNNTHPNYNPKTAVDNASILVVRTSGDTKDGAGNFNDLIKKYLGSDALNMSGTVAGVSGAQTINKPAGIVQFAALASSLVVTNNLVTANSIILTQLLTNDGTMKTVSATPAAGSFTLNGDAATGVTRVGFLVINLF